MRLGLAFELALFGAIACAACKKTAPPDPGAPSLVAGSDDAGVPSTTLVTPQTTSPEIALGNLDVEVRGYEAAVARNPNDVGSARQLVELLLTRGQFNGRIADYERAGALADTLVKRHPESGDAHLAHAAGLGTFHLFAQALDAAAAAERAKAAGVAVAHVRATAYMGQGRFDEAEALGLWRDTAQLDSMDLASAAVLAGERGSDADSERLFEKARASYRDVSPFPIAWVDFQRGSLLERKGSRARAKLYFAEAHTVLPTFAHAAVHLAALSTPEQARLLLEPLLVEADDPEVEASYADVLRRLGRSDESMLHVARARDRYEDLLGRHPEAFADHAASFYLGLGRNTGRALELARQNADNRQTEAALELLIVAALEAGARGEACSAGARGARLRYTTPAFRATIETARHVCADANAVSRSP